MKLRYYLRGIGTGMIVTALILSIALGNGNEKMTEEQIKAKAAELGMVEEKLLSDVQNETKEVNEEATEEVNQEATEKITIEATDGADDSLVDNMEDKQAVDSGMEAAAEETLTDQPAKTEQIDLGNEADSEIGSNLSEVTIEVNGGESSVVISKKLEAAGIITSAVDYDKYLCNNGFDKKICVGTHIIPGDADYPEIAKILTSKQ